MRSGLCMPAPDSVQSNSRNGVASTLALEHADLAKWTGAFPLVLRDDGAAHHVINTSKGKLSNASED
ncbi:hypothetical protein VNO77_03121 [Canavalia gladiata]|uniref:Uncharacterized protein n=1 Tax=Canavalia gladiata TaxID=3824 RepID=A0AAN9MZT8_CANGL